MSNKSHSKPKIGLLSIGDMGVGIAKLLIAHGFLVATNISDRSQDTIERARIAQVELLESDTELIQQSLVILSVVPPKDAEATAARIVKAVKDSRSEKELYLVDLNAVAPSTTKSIAVSVKKEDVPIRFVDGSILGQPPKLTASSDAEANSSSSNDLSNWYRPSIPISGPDSFTSLPYGEKLISVLNMRYISPDIGAASGLKMCFASLTKGFTAIATQSFTTAHNLGVLGALKEELSTFYPNVLTNAEKGVPSMPPKAYRWVREMEEIALTFNQEAGWDKGMFEGAANIYRAVAEDEVLGQEKVGKRKRGTTLDDVAAAAAEGLQKKRKSQ
ncbi:putative 28.5 kda protein in 7s rna 5'region [Fusarium sporotrichioides]|uniref:Putative 28.5 kDa protein in 7s rna 5'region n=1 Tax=Fusarium sporotrichioides TaxID=5514 RepID=A0A395RGZ4_FUSSP|nr:putative 28.5 kda protein in 7s rna 5'region [Fusarium sporotrichioides]